MAKEPEQKYWQELGFRGGLEIHQQLKTTKKLFCRCPVGYLNGKADARIVRHMRPTLSEMGEYDGTALMEFKTKKDVVYELFSDATCTYEMDDTPPFPINQQALDIAIEIALLLNCSIVDEVHVTRKQYLDGSIPTGFQRTLVVGIDGYIPFKGRKLKITQVNLEEDACRERSDQGHKITFRTDRLSTPLVEVITDKEIYSPEEMQQVNKLLSQTLRCSANVRRGIGAARQDVNVSIAGGDRVEIKGVMRYQKVAKLTAVEANRQKALLELREELTKKFKKAENLKITTKIFKSSEINFRTHLPELAKAKKNLIGAIKLEKLSGVFASALQQGSRTFGHDVAGRVRVIACLESQPAIFHTDQGEDDKLLAADWKMLRRELKAKEEDLVVIAIGCQEDVETALYEVEVRVKEIFSGVPRETRQDLGNGLTDFERILPGPDRMYPDTDSEPVSISEQRVKKIAQKIALRPWEKLAQLKELKLPEEIAEQLANGQDFYFYQKLATANKQQAFSLAVIVAHYFSRLRKKQLDPQAIEEKVLLALSLAFKDKKIFKEALFSLLVKLAKTTENQEKILSKQLQRQVIAGQTLEKLVKEKITKAKEKFKGDLENLPFFAMKEIVKAGAGLLDSKEALELAKSLKS